MHETFIFLLLLFPASDELDTAEVELVTLSRSVIISLLPKTPRHYCSQNYSLRLIRQVIPQNQIALNYPNVISGDSLYLTITAVKCSLKPMKILRLNSNGEARV